MKLSIRAICFIGMFAAVTAVLSIISIPTPWGVPFTLQTFAIALCGYVMGARCAVLSTALYILLGLVGVPVYAGMQAGPGVLFGATGGYLFGFLLMAFFCGIAMECACQTKSRPAATILFFFFSVLGLAGCHILGIIRLKAVMGISLSGAALSGSVPYLPKDVLSAFGAYMVALGVRRGLLAANLLDAKQKEFVFLHKSTR